MQNQKSSITPYRYLLFLLFCGYALSFADRVVFALVLKPIKIALALSDSRAGLLAGAGFAITYALFAPVGGFFIDRFRRKLIFAFAVTFWSCGSFASGLVASQSGMMFSRASVGVGEALFIPLAVSLLADVVPLAKRAQALAIFFSAGSVGSLGVTLIGGELLQLFGQRRLVLPVIGYIQPWQSLFMLLALPGFLLSLLVLLTLREPARGVPHPDVHGPTSVSTESLSAFLRRNRILAFALFFGYPGLQMGSQAVTSWTFVFLDRIHGLPAGKGGVLVGLTAGLTSIAGCVFGGQMVGLLRRLGFRDASLRASLVGGLAFGLFAILGLLIPSLRLSLVFFSIAFFFSYTPTVGAYAAISEVAPAHIRAGIAGICSLTSGLLTAALGPWLVGFLSDRAFPTPTGIRLALLTVIAATAVVGGVLVYAGLPSLRSLLASAELGSTKAADMDPVAVSAPFDTL